ncbi:MAG TPA: hypothetical protein VMZ30_06980 [Pyrinomonadaceae bacterium]|nr:hypothetical protein [Pyrinomonadaceae bacterium]
MFVTRKSEQFLKRFREAVDQTEAKIDELRARMHDSSYELTTMLEDLRSEIGTTLNEVFSNAEEANSNADEANGSIQEVYGLLREMSNDYSIIELRDRVIALHRSVDALIHHLTIKDPNERRKIQELENISFLMAGKFSATKIKQRLKEMHPYVSASVIAHVVEKTRRMKKDKKPARPRPAVDITEPTEYCFHPPKLSFEF